MAISIGAVLGANARYLVGGWLADRLGATFPYGTLVINLTGSFLIGLVMV
ncbi:MAG: fluoride efflux transporter FluC, partial [Candidatus Limnocylindrales bacterium]